MVSEVLIFKKTSVCVSTWYDVNEETTYIRGNLGEYSRIKKSFSIN